MSTPKLDTTIRDKIRSELNKGNTQLKIAKKLGVSTGTVSNVKRGIEVTNDVLLRREKEKANEYQQKYEDAVREVDTIRRELELLSCVDNFSKHFRPVNIKPKHGGKGEATPIVCIADWHVEEEIDKGGVNGANEFNLKIAGRRIKTLWSAAASLIDMYKTRSKIDTVITPILGDLISGHIHDELMATNNMTPGEAIMFVFDHLVSGLEFLVKETKAKELIVPCVCGNHGRWTKTRWSKNGPGMSFEGMLYNMMARWFEAQKNRVIRFVLPQGDMTYITVYGRVIRIMHGDNIRYSGGIGGVHIPLRKAIDAWNTVRRADYNYLGHYHTDLSGEDYRMSGGLVGYSEWALRVKARYQPPTQAIELQHPRYGSTARFPIHLE